MRHSMGTLNQQQFRARKCGSWSRVDPNFKHTRAETNAAPLGAAQGDLGRSQPSIAMQAIARELFSGGIRTNRH